MICWFRSRVSDARPTALSSVDGLAFLPYSHCPHYADSLRQALYHRQILDSKLGNGYACDDLSGILFKNGKAVKSVSAKENHHSYLVTAKNGKIDARKLDSEILINKNAIPLSAYTAADVNKKIAEFSPAPVPSTPLEAYVAVQYRLMNGQNSKYKEMASRSLKEKLDNFPDAPVNETRKQKILDAKINRVLIYNDSVAGVINKAYPDFYGLWYFYKEDGKWMSAGEDIGGDTVLESEITFREKAPMHLKKVQAKVLPINP